LRTKRTAEEVTKVEKEDDVKVKVVPIDPNVIEADWDNE